MSINGGERARVNKLKVNKHQNKRVALKYIYFLIIIIIQWGDKARICSRTKAHLHIRHPESHACIYLVLRLPFNNSVHGGNIRLFSHRALVPPPALTVFFSYWKRVKTRSLKGRESEQTWRGFKLIKHKQWVARHCNERTVRVQLVGGAVNKA